MKKKLLFATTGFVFMMSSTALAGQWRNNATGWWYDYGNGSYPASSWQWIDGNGDGIAECYYFDHYGYCLLNGVTPDGYMVDGNGAWTVDGTVQVKMVQGSGTSVSENQDEQQYGQTEKEVFTLYDQETIIDQELRYRESAKTNKEKDTWARVLRFGNTDWLYGVSYAEYYSGGQYTSFKATIAPENDAWDKDDIMILQVLGDNDELLYESGYIDYRTNSFDVEVDISGQDSITLYVIQEEGGWSTIIMKNARFE